MNIPRDVPGPRTTANEEVHRLDAEAEAFMAAHALGIIEAWNRTGDPASYLGWDNAAVRQHWPELWSLWRAVHQAKDRLVKLMHNEYARRQQILDPGTK